MAADPRPTGGKIWARPVFRVADIARSLAYYCDALGFAKDWVEDGPDPAVAQVSRLGVALMLDKHTYFPKAAGASVVALTLNDVPNHPALDALHRQLAAAGAKITRAPFKVHWDVQVHEMDVEDPDGNVLMFWGHVLQDKHPR